MRDEQCEELLKRPPRFAAAMPTPTDNPTLRYASIIGMVATLLLGIGIARYALQRDAAVSALASQIELAMTGNSQPTSPFPDSMPDGPIGAADPVRRPLERTQLLSRLRSGAAGMSARDLGEIYDNSATERELRGQVILTLSQRRNDTAAVDKLLDIARKEPDPELRKQALFWLGQSRDPRAVATLEEIINKPI